MTIQQLTVPPIGTNCYILIDETTNHAAIVDPGGGAEEILKAAAGLTVDAIFLTHGHFDHTGAAAVLRETFGCPIYLHPADKAMMAGDLMPPVSNTVDYSDGDTVTVGSLTVAVVHTPGHTPGGVCLLVENTLFAGDTLFKGSMGRTDLPGGGYEILMSSLRRLGGLPGNYRVLPGHEGDSTLDAERRENYYLREAMQ